MGSDWSRIAGQYSLHRRAGAWPWSPRLLLLALLSLHLTYWLLSPAATAYDPAHDHVVLGGTGPEQAQALLAHRHSHDDHAPAPALPLTPLWLTAGPCDQPAVLSVPAPRATVLSPGLSLAMLAPVVELAPATTPQAWRLPVVCLSATTESPPPRVPPPRASFSPA